MRDVILLIIMIYPPGVKSGDKYKMYVLGIFTYTCVQRWHPRNITCNTFQLSVSRLFDLTIQTEDTNGSTTYRKMTVYCGQ